ncbi:MAG: hypothetical protein ACP5K7_12295, partial [Verrucomicrobiia bacterium]
EVVFDSLLQILQVFYSLPQKPEVLTSQINNENLKSWLKTHPNPQTIKEWAKKWIQGYRLRKKNEKNL